MSEIAVNSDVQVRKPGLKFTTVLDGKVLSIDAESVATVALEDNSVAKVPTKDLTLKGASVVRARAASGSFASKVGF